MGLDLSIGICSNSEENIREYSFRTYNKLDFERNGSTCITDVEFLWVTKAVECDFKVVWVDGKEVKEDQYGRKLRYLKAKQFNEIEVRSYYGRWNGAIMTFLRAIHPEEIVVLFWH